MSARQRPDSDSAESNHRPLRPATDRQSQGPASVQSVQDRASQSQPPRGRLKNPLRKNLTPAACERCRKRKGKCSGERPTCGACSRVGEDCIYDVPANESRYTALKRKHRSLEKDNADLQELIHHLRSRPESEATTILQCLRSRPDSSGVLQHVKDSDILLEASLGSSDDIGSGNRTHAVSPRSSDAPNTSITKGGDPVFTYAEDRSISPNSVLRKRKILSSPKSAEQLEELYHYLQVLPEMQLLEVLQRIRAPRDPFSVVDFIKHGDPTTQKALTTDGDEDSNKPRRLLDLAALNESAIQVPARPWTIVAGDGIVSHLISIFFRHFQPVGMPFINEQVFVADMIAGNVGRTSYCSSLLVNTVCAYTAVISQFSRKVDKVCGGSLHARFRDEARKLLQREFGRPSPTTIQALYTLFAYSSAQGMDRAGRLFRTAGAEMYSRLGLGTNAAWTKCNQLEDDKSREIRCQNAWGLLWLECLAASLYQQKPIISIPDIPRPFLDRKISAKSAAYSVSSEDVLYMQSGIAKIIACVLQYRSRVTSEIGGETDVETRKEFYDDLCEWKGALLCWTIDRPHLQRLNASLHGMFHSGVIMLYNDLLGPHQETRVCGDGQSPAEICVEHCRGLLRQIRTLNRVRPLEPESNTVMTVFLGFFLLMTLIPLLGNDSENQDLFVQACAYIYKQSLLMPAATAVLSGAKALSQQLGVNIPSAALKYLRAAQQWPQPNDVPFSWSVPNYSSLVDPFGGAMAIELGNIIAKWNSLSICD